MSGTMETRVTETVIVEVGVPGVPGPAGPPGSTFYPLAFDLVGLAANMPRSSAINAGSALSSGQINLQLMTVHTDGESTGPLMFTGSGAGSGATYNRMALYRVDPTGYTRLAITAELGAALAASSAVTPAWLIPVDVAAGDRLAVAQLTVTAGSTPAFRGATQAGMPAANFAPYAARQVVGAVDLPAFIANGSASYQSTFLPYAAIL